MPQSSFDHCGNEISRARDGNYEWRSHTDSKNPEDAYFTHRKCSDPFRTAHPEPEDGWMWASMELLVFPLYLANNLEIDQKNAQEMASRMAEL